MAEFSGGAPLAPVVAASMRIQGIRRALHMPQNTLNHLLQVGLALSQVLVLHLIKLARNKLQLRCERPLRVVQTLGDPVLHAAREHIVLQQHQMHIEHRRQLGGGFFA